MYYILGPHSFILHGGILQFQDEILKKFNLISLIYSCNNKCIKHKKKSSVLSTTELTTFLILILIYPLQHVYDTIYTYYVDECLIGSYTPRSSTRFWENN